MTQTTRRCKVANGTYVCSKAAGHYGEHENMAALYNGENRKIGTRAARFTDPYSEVRFFTLKFVRKITR